MKIVVALIGIVIAGWTSMEWSSKIDETEVIVNGEYTIIFLNKDAAADYLSKSDFYERMNDYFDASIRLEKDLSSKRTDENRNLIENFAIGQTLDWNKKEINRVSKIMIDAQNGISKNYKNVLNDTLYLIKTTGEEEFNAYYTINNAIVIPKKETKMLWMKPRKIEVQGTYIHELLHIFTRNNLAKRLELYNLIGFKQSETFKLPKELENKMITNPDLHGNDYVIELKDSTGTSNQYTLLITSKYPKYEGKKGVLGRLNTLMGYIDVGLFKLDSTGYVIDQRLEMNEEFFKKIGTISSYRFGADEIIAEAFRVLIQSENGNLPNNPDLNNLETSRNIELIKQISTILKE